MTRVAFSFFLTGLLFGSGPCLVSCGPLLVSYFAARRKSLGSGLVFYLFFSLGRIFVYTLFSLLLFYLGRLAVENFFFSGSARYLFIASAAFLIFIGAMLVAGGKRFKFCYANFIEKDTKSALILGALAGIVPCVPFLAVFSYAGLISGSLAIALASALSFGLGTALSPLLLLALLAGRLPAFLLREDKRGVFVFNVICGLIIIFLGLRLGWRGFNA